MATNPRCQELLAAGSDVNAVALGSVPGRPLHWAARSQSAGEGKCRLATDQDM